MILPGSLPLDDGNARNELIYYLGPGWDPVMDRDIDGEWAETRNLDNKEPRFGALQAARRVARTVFLSSAPSSVSTRPGRRGIDRARVLLGCLQPNQTSATYSDALSRLADHLHYMSSSGDKSQDATRYWFDTRANLRREMEERKNRFDDKNEVRGRIAEVVKKMTSGAAFFDGTHVFTPHGDVPDDTALRLVILSPEQAYLRDDPEQAFQSVLEYVRQNGTKPRYRGNRLLFLTPDHAALSRLRESVRIALAWNSIVEDVAGMRLVLDNLQAEQAKQELKTALDVLPRAARECFKWLLCPSQEVPTDKPSVEVAPINTSGASAIGSEIERVCLDNEWVIGTWSPIHLRTKLKELYWKTDKPAKKAAEFWEDSLRYLYLPRLKDRGVLAQAIVKGAATRDFFGTAYGEHDGKFDGFKLGDANVQFDDMLLLIESGASIAYEAANQPAPATGSPPAGSVQPGSTLPAPVTAGTTQPVSRPDGSTSPSKVKSFHGSAVVAPAAAKMRLVQIAEEIIAALAADPNAEVKVRIEIEANFASGARDETKRSVSENAKTLGFNTAEWE
jgi:predicted AAA+ superfamily ATPase